MSRYMVFIWSLNHHFTMYRRFSNSCSWQLPFRIQMSRIEASVSLYTVHQRDKTRFASFISQSRRSPHSITSWSDVALCSRKKKKPSCQVLSDRTASSKRFNHFYSTNLFLFNCIYLHLSMWIPALKDTSLFRNPSHLSIRFCFRNSSDHSVLSFWLIDLLLYFR